MTRRWPLILLALPAGVATWAGWVGLGELAGFGPIKPLPGIADSFTINTAVTLPIGVEAYAAYALHAWLSDSASPRTRRFAGWSALGSLLLGMAGQVAYHLLAVFSAKVAPWQVVTAVSCLPVLVLGMGAALGHMLAQDDRDDHEEPSEVPAAEPSPAEQQAAGYVLERAEADPGALPRDVEPAPVPAGTPALPAQTAAAVPAPDELFAVAAERYAGDLAEGKVPAMSKLRDDLKIGQPRAQRIRTYLGLLVTPRDRTAVRGARVAAVSDSAV